MNEFILNIAGFTPQEWVEFKGRLANRLLSYWRRVAAEITVERIRIVFFVLFVAGLGLFGFQYGMRFLMQRTAREPAAPQESSPSGGVKKERLEITLEELKNDLDKVLEPQTDLEYPSLDLKVSFE